MTRAPEISTYDEDFFAWTQEQAAALRRLPQAAIGATVDVAHVAEEIEDLGERDLREVNAFIVRLLEHLIKIDMLRRPCDIAHWRAEATRFQVSAVDAVSPSLRRMMDVDQLWRRARKLAMEAVTDAQVPEPPARCPFTLDELLSRDFDLQAALAKLAASRVAGA